MATSKEMTKCDVDKILNASMQGYRNMGFKPLFANFYNPKIKWDGMVQYAFDTRVIRRDISELLSYTEKYKESGPHKIPSEIVSMIENYVKYNIDSIRHFQVSGKEILDFNRDDAKNYVIHSFFTFANICKYLFKKKDHPDSRRLLLQLLQIGIIERLQEREMAARTFYTLMLYSVNDTFKTKNPNDPLYKYISSLNKDQCLQFLDIYIRLLEITQSMMVDKMFPTLPTRKGGRKNTKRRKRKYKKGTRRKPIKK